jgi:hypothetical protein
MTVSEKIINDSGEDKAALTFIHDYLESRQTLLKTIPVSNLSPVLHPIQWTSAVLGMVFPPQLNRAPR